MFIYLKKKPQCNRCTVIDLEFTYLIIEWITVITD